MKFKNNKLPEISIIIPVYKAEKYLYDCINSVLIQTFRDFELILVNDGSPDGSGKICDLFAEKDKRIKVIHKPNGGASTARKAGVEAATGKYLGWVDADDRIAPDMISTLYDLSKKYNADIAECQFYTIVGGKKLKSGPDEPEVYGTGDFILHEFFSSRMKPSFCNKLFKRDLFKNIDFPRRQIHVDSYMQSRFALMPLSYARTSEAKYFYIVRENSNYTTYTSKEIREAIYLYDYLIALADDVANSDLQKKYLKNDAIRRLLTRYFQISVHSNLKDQNIYNKIIKKKLDKSLFNYLYTTHLPLKTKISYILLLSNQKGLQSFIHKLVGIKYVVF